MFMDIEYQLVKRTEKVQLPEKLEFGRLFTDHMFIMEYTPEKGWHNAKITKYEPFNISLASIVLHYGQTIFEGLKAYKRPDGKIGIFRPEKNFERLNNSARRMCMPEVDIDFVLKALYELIKIERDWIPDRPGTSLYIRPLMFGNDPFLGVRPSDTYIFTIILSPVGAYYKEGFKPVKILATDKYVRAVRKGLGECKTAANYAASLLAFKEAQQQGFSQVLWLDAIEQKYIEEVGTMNLFVQIGEEITTAPLMGTILPGITRMSVIELLKHWKLNIQERRVSIDEVVEAYKNGSLKDVFGAGTAAVISSVGILKYKDIEMTINNNQPGEIALKLYDEITGIQYGTKPDIFNWVKIIE